VPVVGQGAGTSPQCFSTRKLRNALGRGLTLPSLPATSTLGPAPSGPDLQGSDAALSLASDIFAGAVIGVALMLLLCRLIGAAGLPDRVVRFSATHPSAFYAIAWLVALEIAVRFDAVQAFLSDAARLARAVLF
jgi:hypothetical protein